MDDEKLIVTKVHIDWENEGATELEIVGKNASQITELFDEYNEQYDGGKFQGSFNDFLDVKGVKWRLFNYVDLILSESESRFRNWDKQRYGNDE